MKKNFFVFTTLAVVMTLVLVIIACNDDDTPGGTTFVPVTDITGVTTIYEFSDLPIVLSGTVEPVTATNKTIAWSLKTEGTTAAGAAVNGGQLSATGAGNVVVTATVNQGVNAAYTKDFTITITSGGGDTSDPLDAIGIAIGKPYNVGRVNDPDADGGDTRAHQFMPSGIYDHITAGPDSAPYKAAKYLVLKLKSRPIQSPFMIWAGSIPGVSDSWYNPTKFLYQENDQNKFPATVSGWDNDNPKHANGAGAELKTADDGTFQLWIELSSIENYAGFIAQSVVWINFPLWGPFAVESGNNGFGDEIIGGWLIMP